MSRNIKFIDTVIRNIKPTNKRQIFWCEGCPGFGLRVSPSGTKSFVFKYMAERKSRWITIGKYPKWSIRQARRQYDDYYEEVHEYGRDPVGETKKQIEADKAKRFVKDLIKEYIDLSKRKGKSSWSEEERAFKADVIPVIGDLFVDAVTHYDIDLIQNRIFTRAVKRKSATQNGRVAIKNTLAYTRQLFNYAERRGLIDVSPVKGIDSLGKSAVRNRVLSFEELWLFWNGIENVNLPPVTAKTLKFVLATMQRGIEVRNMTYSSLKIEDRIWEMQAHETKNKTMHRVPLNKYAIQLIDEVRPYTESSDFVFGSTRVKNPPSERRDDLSPLGKTALSQALRKSRSELGVEDICPHDLRRTGATWITAIGLPKLYPRLMLNHNDGDKDVTGEVYVQYSYDFEKRRAIDVWEFILDQIVRCKSKDDIPNLDTLRKRANSEGIV